MRPSFTSTFFDEGEETNGTGFQSISGDAI